MTRIPPRIESPEKIVAPTLLSFGKKVSSTGLKLVTLCSILILFSIRPLVAGAGGPTPPPSIESGAEVNESLAKVYVGFLKNKDAKIRSMAAISLKTVRLNPEARKRSFPLLLEAFKDQDGKVRADVLSVITNLIDLSDIRGIESEVDDDELKSIIMDHTIAALKDPESTVRIVALRNLGNAEKAIPHIIVALKDSDIEVQYNASLSLKNSLARRRYDRDASKSTKKYAAETKILEKEAATELVKYLTSPDDRLRLTVVETLGEISLDTGDFIPIFLAKLKDPSSSIRASAASALGKVLEKRSNSGEPGLLQKLFPNEDKEVKEIIAALIHALEDSDDLVQNAAAEAIGEAGKTAKSAISTLVPALRSSNGQVRQNAARALGRIGGGAKEVIPALTSALDDVNLEVRLDSAIAISQIDSTSKVFIPVLLEALKENNEEKNQFGNVSKGGRTEVVEESVTTVMSKNFRDGKPSSKVIDVLTNLALELDEIIPELIKASKNEDESIRSNSLIALDRICTKVASNYESHIGESDGVNLETRISVLEKILAQLPNSVDRESKISPKGYNVAFSIEEQLERRKTQRETLNLLKAKRDYLFWERISKLLKKNPLILVGVLIPGGYLVILRFFPRTLLLLPAEITIPKVGIKLPLGIIKWLKYRPRVLDAWIAVHLPTATDSFSRLETVQQRRVHVALPLPASLTLPSSMDGKTYPELYSAALQPIFTAKEFCLLIHGDGGIGKTSLACQIAQWTMGDDAKQRPSNHPMLPILSEQDFDPDVEKGKQLLSAIKGRLERLIQSPETIPDELLDQLLRQRRLLVIIDHFSELSKETQQAFKPGSPNFPVKALIVTSRIKEELDQVQKATIALPRISSSAGQLTAFLENYLKAKQQDTLFRTPTAQIEFNTHCNRLIAMAGSKGITILLAKLYAELMIVQASGTSIDDLPATIPDVMLSYLNELNSGALEKVFDDRTIQQDAQLLAWACLQTTYRPKPIQREAALTLLSGDNAKERLNHLENRLQLLQTVGSAKDQVRFILDPLAEYLAGSHLIKIHTNDETAWQGFFHKANEFQPEEIQGFMQAVHDCCYLASAEGKITETVVNQFALVQTGN
jgi:HEAT repeat protein